VRAHQSATARDISGLGANKDLGANLRGGSHSPDHPARQEVPRPRSQGEILVQCLEGRAAFIALGRTQVLEAGKLLYLPANEPHEFRGVEDASVLLTILAPRH
jgi:hypothetical protein